MDDKLSQCVFNTNLCAVYITNTDDRLTHVTRRQGLCRCHTKRRMGAHGRAHPSFGMTPTKTLTSRDMRQAIISVCYIDST